MTQLEQDEHDFDSQYRRPSGALGQRIGQEMARDHVPENLWTVARLNPQPADRILEIGFGPGIAIEALAAQVSTGWIAGIDFSELMVSEASKRNAAAIEAGRVTLQYGDAATLPFKDELFDKVFSIHAVYFWSDPMDVLREAWRVLKPGGLLVITMLPKDRWSPNASGSALEYGTAECIPYFGSELEQMMREAGFSSTRIEADAGEVHRSNFSVLGTK
jgi:ubiquinone/menaquinone biosynthesis C-methylase UbiE